MCRIEGRCDAGWAEPLPQFCPPNEASNPSGETLYRLVAANPPSIEDFRSHRYVDPEKYFNASECATRSVSIWMSIERCRKLLLLPTHKGKRIAAIVIAPNSGAVSKKTNGHVSWWRCAAYDPVPTAKVVE